jgi:electron transfer flavoprotein alpha subunit
VTVLCLVEREADGAPVDASLRALAFARRLAISAHGTVTAVLFASLGTSGTEDAAVGGLADAEGDGVAGPADAVGADVTGLADAEVAGAAGLAGRGVAEVVVVSAGDGYAPAAWARGLAELTVSCAAAAVVAAATDRGGEVLAHLGAITGQPVAANCVRAEWVAPGDCQLTRQRWAGSLLEDATLDATLALLTVAPDTQPADLPTEDAGSVGLAVSAAAAVPTDGESAGPGTAPAPAPPEVPVRSFRPDLDPADLWVQAVESAERPGGVSLATARVVVGGGRGVGGPEGFAVLEELAALLGGTLGVSRVVTSQGWRPHRQQVGQTGTRISPELYLACGISGAIQHMAGCLGARHIVAVNTDPDAPIIAHADYAVIGDLAAVIPALVAALRARDT